MREINKHVWLVDTLSRYDRLSRAEINDLWRRSGYGDGSDLPARTFYYYRRAIEENFHLEILCDKEGRYYIDPEQRRQRGTITNWLLEYYAANSALKDFSVPSSRVEVEDVPSAREYLPIVLSAISDASKIKFTYAGFSRSRPDEGIVFSPYFVKRYKQRWYMVGAKDRTKGLRTYALDRVKSMAILPNRFLMPDLTPEVYFKNLIGVTASKGDVKTVKIKVTPTQAKYFRALPFHATQQEEAIADSYSIFSYKLKINYELIHELLSYGDAVEVLEPRELIIGLTDELKRTLNLYTSK